VYVDGYGRTIDTSYRDFVRPDGSEIFQSLKLNMVPVGVSLRVVPTSKRARVAPYVGGGVDAIYWKYEEFGDFIDFFDPDYTIYADHFRSDGWAFGAHVMGGVRVYVNRDFAIVGEGRYQWAEKDMGEDFAPNEPGLVNRIDLTGATFTVGVHIRF
jgi:opacity protein-like surface antigen